MPIKMKKVKPPILTPEELREFEGYRFDYDNLALEGGGCGAMAHVGVIRVLEELGILENIKRYAGSSSGSIVATYLALGYNSHEIQKLFQKNFEPLLYDACCGPCGWIVNLVRHMGANPGKRLETWIARNIRAKTKVKNYTFRKLYEEHKIELCILAADLSMMDVVYFHVKTTPDMPIYLAARASSSIPGILQPVKFNNCVYVDGGVLCNYPLHVYDGWYLSMEPGDRFLNKFGDLAKVCKKWTTAERFGDVTNDKTLGVMLYSDADPVLMQDHMEKRNLSYRPKEGEIVKPIVRPKTKLSRERQRKEKKMTESMNNMEAALCRLMAVLQTADKDNNGSVSRQDFRDFFRENGDALKTQDIELLFGTVKSKNVTDAIFDKIDSNKDGKITYKEVMELAEERGVNLAQTIRGYESRDIDDIKGLFSALFETLMMHAQRVTAKSSDCSRTIGINTEYLGTFDWNMKKDDKEFLVQCGKQAALCFLRERIATPHTSLYPKLH